MQTMYIAICFGFWGRGNTEAEALASLRKAGGRKSDKTTVYRNDRPDGKDKPFVDDHGMTHYFGTLSRVAEIIRGQRKAAPGVPGIHERV